MDHLGSKAKNTEKLKPLKKAQNNNIAKCCRLGLIEPVYGLYWLRANYRPRPLSNRLKQNSTFKDDYCKFEI